MGTCCNRNLSAPLVSVCIPTHNGRRFIAETLRSVLNSSYLQIEVVVSDDASIDGTLDEVAALTDPRIRITSGMERLGPVGNWNRALRAARGELLCLLNHDDLCGPFWIDVAVRGLARFPAAGWAGSAFKVVDAAGKTLSVESRFPASGVYSGTYPFLVIAQLNGLGPGFIARRHVLEEVAYFNEKAGFGADNDIFLRLISRYPLLFSAVPHNAWRRHEMNLTHSWPLSQQANEGAQMLLALVNDPACPEWLRACHPVSLHNLSLKLEQRASERMSAGDHGTAQELLDLSASLLLRSQTTR